jgi:hypothetical protein
VVLLPLLEPLLPVPFPVEPVLLPFPVLPEPVLLPVPDAPDPVDPEAPEPVSGLLVLPEPVLLADPVLLPLPVLLPDIPAPLPLPVEFMSPLFPVLSPLWCLCFLCLPFWVSCEFWVSVEDDDPLPCEAVDCPDVEPVLEP